MLKTARDFLEYIIEGKRLTRKDSYSLMRGLMKRVYFFPDGKHLLLRMRKEDGEIAGFAEAMREKAMNFSVFSLLWLIIVGQEEMDRNLSTSHCFRLQLYLPG